MAEIKSLITGQDIATSQSIKIDVYEEDCQDIAYILDGTRDGDWKARDLTKEFLT